MKAKAEITHDSLRKLLGDRGLTEDAAAVIAGIDTSTVSRILSGKRRARPETVVRLARGLGISARRMQEMADAAWAHANDERVPA